MTAKNLYSDAQRAKDQEEVRRVINNTPRNSSYVDAVHETIKSEIYARSEYPALLKVLKRTLAESNKLKRDYKAGKILLKDYQSFIDDTIRELSKLKFKTAPYAPTPIGKKVVKSTGKLATGSYSKYIYDYGPGHYPKQKSLRFNRLDNKGKTSSEIAIGPTATNKNLYSDAQRAKDQEEVRRVINNTPRNSSYVDAVHETIKSEIYARSEYPALLKVLKRTLAESNKLKRDYKAGKILLKDYQSFIDDTIRELSKLKFKTAPYAPTPIGKKVVKSTGKLATGSYSKYIYDYGPGHYPKQKSLRFNRLDNKGKTSSEIAIGPTATNKYSYSDTQRVKDQNEVKRVIDNYILGKKSKKTSNVKPMSNISSDASIKKMLSEFEEIGNDAPKKTHVASPTKINNKESPTNNNTVKDKDVVDFLKKFTYGYNHPVKPEKAKGVKYASLPKKLSINNKKFHLTGAGSSNVRIAKNSEKLKTGKNDNNKQERNTIDNFVSSLDKEKAKNIRGLNNSKGFFGKFKTFPKRVLNTPERKLIATGAVSAGSIAGFLYNKNVTNKIPKPIHGEFNISKSVDINHFYMNKEDIPSGYKLKTGKIGGKDVNFLRDSDGNKLVVLKKTLPNGRGFVRKVYKYNAKTGKYSLYVDPDSSKDLKSDSSSKSTTKTNKMNKIPRTYYSGKYDVIGSNEESFTKLFPSGYPTHFKLKTGNYNGNKVKYLYNSKTKEIIVLRLNKKDQEVTVCKYDKTNKKYVPYFRKEKSETETPEEIETNETGGSEYTGSSGYYGGTGNTSVSSGNKNTGSKSNSNSSTNTEQTQQATPAVTETSYNEQGSMFLTQSDEMMVAIDENGNVYNVSSDGLIYEGDTVVGSVDSSKVGIEKMVDGKWRMVVVKDANGTPAKVNFEDPNTYVKFISNTQNSTAAVVSTTPITSTVANTTDTAAVAATTQATTATAVTYQATNGKIGQACSNIDGKAGDKSGKEVRKSRWTYSSSSSSPFNWTYVFRFKDPSKALQAADMCEKGIANNNIGYTHNSKTAYGKNSAPILAKKVGYDLSKINVKTGLSCGDLITLCIKYTGIKCKYIGTGLGVSKELKRLSGDFECYTSKSYVASKSNLKRGDILVTAHSNGKHNHVSMVL